MEKYVSRPWFCCVLIGLLVLLVWGKSIFFGFVWDDHYFIIENQGIRSLKNIPEMFCSRVADASNPADFPLFRPLRNVMFAVLYWLGGKDLPQPWIFHLANVLWQAAAAMLVFSV